MSKKLIGYGYTNNKGIATLDYDADGNPLQTSGYTGTGAGNIDFIAQYHDGTSEFVSGTYSVIDAILNWEGTNGTVPSILKSSSNTAMPLISDSNGLSMTNSHSSSTYYCGLDKEQSSSSIGDWVDWCDVAFEFEYVSHTGNVVFQLRPQSSSVTQYNLNNCSNGDIIRVEYTNGVVNVFKNNTNVLTGNMNVGELTAIRFSLAPSNTLTIKNMKLWSI